MPCLPLNLLSAGEMGDVVDVIGPEAAVHRLAELGIRPGVPIAMIRTGDPCIVGFGDVRFSLRLDPDVEIFVQSRE